MISKINKFIIICSISISLLLGQELSALEIMEKVMTNPKPSSSITEINLEIIRYKRGKEKVKIREFTRFQKNYKSGKFKSRIVTEIEAISDFYKAENYHQDYYKKRGIDGCAI